MRKRILLNKEKSFNDHPTTAWINRKNITQHKHNQNQVTFKWRIIQMLMLCVGSIIVSALFLQPELGIHLLWNFLIPIAPAVFVLSVPLWRNICPLGTVSLLPHHLQWSSKIKLTKKQVEVLYILAVLFLYIILPARHLIFNVSGIASGILLISISCVAFLAGFRYEWKSGWCSGLCPVHPVEKLYGISNRKTMANAHCQYCAGCVVPCPDSSKKTVLFHSKISPLHKLLMNLMVGGFPGFIWGWFHVKDYMGAVHFSDVISAYLPPMIGLVCTTSLYLLLNRWIQTNRLIPFFGASAVAIYYWYRIPALMGFGLYPGDGMLVDLSNALEEWMALAIAGMISTCMIYLLISKTKQNKGWMRRPKKLKQLKIESEKHERLIKI